MHINRTNYMFGCRSLSYALVRCENGEQKRGRRYLFWIKIEFFFLFSLVNQRRHRRRLDKTVIHLNTSASSSSSSFTPIFRVLDSCFIASNRGLRRECAHKSELEWKSEIGGWIVAQTAKDTKRWIKRGVAWRRPETWRRPRNLHEAMHAKHTTKKII